MSNKLRLCCILIVCLFAAMAVMSVALIFTFKSTPLSALSDGSGTQQDPYRISTAQQLSNLQELSCGELAEELTGGKYFVLTRDLTVYAYPLTSAYGFGGHLDGQGHTVKVKGHGLFYRLAEGAELANLNVRIAMRATHANLYGISYYLEAGAVISHCSVEGNIMLNTDKIARRSQTPSVLVSPFVICNKGLITDCTYRGNIGMKGTGLSKAEYFALGCFCAADRAQLPTGSVVNCHAQANITLNYVPIEGNTNRYTIGGLSSHCKAENCLFEGDIRLTVPQSCAADPLFRMFLLAPTAPGCTFRGDALCDYTGHAATGIVKLSNTADCTQEGNLQVVNGK